MPPVILALVLGAALLHATWNAMLRSSGDRLLSVTVMDVAVAFVTLPFLFLLPAPETGAWAYILLSALIHVGYSLLLVEIYQHGELGQVYPIARGSSPLLVTLGASVFAGEHLGPLTCAGIALISFGIIALARGKNRASPRLILTALATGGMIGAYTIADGIGARLSGHALSYAAWMFTIYGMMMAGYYRLRRGLPTISFTDPAIRKSALAGILGLVGYCIIIWAISIHSMGPVSALRETSVVFAALIGRFFLKEKLTPRRMAACAVIALGAAFLN